MKMVLIQYDMEKGLNLDMMTQIYNSTSRQFEHYLLFDHIFILLVQASVDSYKLNFIHRSP